MALTPAQVVPAPEPRGQRYGLFIAANGPIDLTGNTLGSGLTYEPVSCGVAHTYPIECDDTPPEKSFDEAEDYITADPFVVYGSFTCGAVGNDVASVAAKALRRLANGEQAQVEAQLGTLLAADSQPVSPGDPGDLAYVVSELEEWLYGVQLYGHAGVIHAPILAAAHAHAAGLVVESKQVQGLLTTRMGTAWSFGNYPDNGTVYISGAVTVWRATEPYFPPNEQTFDRTANQWYGLAEREYAVAWDCLAAQAAYTPDTLS